MPLAMFINLMQNHGNQVSEKPFWVYCVRGNGISSVSNTLSCGGNFHQEIRVSTHAKLVGALPRDFTNNNLILLHFAAHIYAFAIGIIEVRLILFCLLSLTFLYKKKNILTYLNYLIEANHDLEF